MVKNRLMIALAAFALSGALAPLPAASQTQAKLSIGIGFAVDFLPAFVAKDTGIFDRHGLDVTFIPLATPSVVPSILVGGSAQIAYATLPNLILGAEGGLDLVAIEGAARLKKSNPKISLLTRPGITVTKAEDLEGKKVGVPGFNSIIDMFLRKWLLMHNVPVTLVTINETPMTQMGDLMKAGQIDASTPVEPLLGRFVASGSGVKSIDFFSEVNPDVLGSFWMSTRDWATAHPTEVGAFRAAIAEGVTYVQDHPDESNAIEKKYMWFVNPGKADYTLKVEPADFDFIIKLTQELGISHQTLDASKLILN